MNRQNFSSGAVWEPITGYSRVVRAGSHVYVAGTAATDPDGKIVGENDAYTQTRYTLEKIQRALEGAGVALSQVVLTRLYVTDISQWEVVGRAHGEFFRDILPVTTMVEVSRLVSPGMLVEIEAEAMV